MGRASKAVAAQHHEELIQTAARLFRERGIGVSVPDLMGELGLTRGGFYKHFESKEALVAAAVNAAFTEHFDRLAAMAERNGQDPASTRAAFVDFCLSPEHRDDPGHGCPSALATAMSQVEPCSAPRTAYISGVRTLLRELAERIGDGGVESDPAEQKQILADLATIVGAVLLARATAGDPISEEFLSAARDRLS